MDIHPDSHLDHELTEDHLAFLLEHFADRDGRFVETVTLPEALGTVPCLLHGPIMGDAPVPDRETIHEHRNGRAWTSRLCCRPVRQVREVSVIAGPHDGKPCVLYTAFGGPVAPKEPQDPSCRYLDASVAFWRLHALSVD